MAFLQIISNNILPLLTFVVIGYLMDYFFRLDLQSLTKLTFYVVLPCFIFYSIYSADIDLNLMTVFLCGAVQMILLSFLGSVVGRIRHWSPGMTEAFRNGTMFSNTGNIGIALAALIFSHPPYLVNGSAPYLPEALAVGTMLLVLMNMTLNTLGLYQAGKGKMTPWDALRVIFHMPVIYVLLSVFIIKLSGLDLTGTFLWPVFKNCANALLAIVMMALGIQIRRSHIVMGDPNAWMACFVRLIGAPLIALGLIFLWGRFSPVASQVILIFSAIPSAVNTVLYAVEFKNYPDFATEVVMLSTFVSCITLTGVIYLARILFPVAV
jgi:predicted permease